MIIICLYYHSVQLPLTLILNMKSQEIERKSLSLNPLNPPEMRGDPTWLSWSRVHPVHLTETPHLNIDREVYLHLLSSFSLRLIQQTVPSCFCVWFAQISGLSLLFSPRGPNKHKTKSTFLIVLLLPLWGCAKGKGVTPYCAQSLPKLWSIPLFKEEKERYQMSQSLLPFPRNRS